jgi:hypothetical protein
MGARSRVHDRQGSCSTIIMEDAMQSETYLSGDETTGLIAASRVKGTSVYDASGEKIGSIDDIMIGKRNGEVAYAVMSFGGFLGIGEKYHPLPWDTLDYDPSVGGYRVGTAGENFRNAPSYDRDAFEDDRWSADTDRYYADASTSGWITRRLDDRSTAPTAAPTAALADRPLA